MVRRDRKVYGRFRPNHNHQTRTQSGAAHSIQVLPIPYDVDGNLLFVTISDILVVYNVQNGDVVTKPTKAVKDAINCIVFAKDGKIFATGSNDKTCVLWRFNLEAERKIEPHLKFTLTESVITLAFNPLTHELFAGGAADFAIYTPGKQDIPKEKYKQKIMCSAWSPDGQTLAFGTMNGTISIRERNLDERNEVKKTAPIWCMEWTPITADHQQSYLLVGCWDKTFYYLNADGEVREKIAERRLPFNPISVNYHASGEFFLCSGANKKISIWSRDLGFLADIVDLKDWSWCSKFKPKSMEVVVTTNDGTISIYELSKKPIFSNYEELFATRDNLTDIVVENLVINQKLRIKCKELVKKISIFKEKLAVLQNERLLIYIASEQSLKYTPFRKITKHFQCDYMAILNSHVVFTKDTKVQLYNLMGQLERQWMFQSQITFMKALGGPPKRQHIVLGMKNGQVFKVFIDNSFPIPLYKSTASIRCCDLNLSKKKLAVVDTNNNMIVLDLITQAHLYQEMGIQSCVWNSDLEDVLAYSGNGMLSIRTGNMPALTQKTEAAVQGFKGFQLFVIKEGKLSVMDVSQSSTLMKFIEKKDFKMAYKLACLGVTDNDIRILGTEALQNNDFHIAEKCFIRIRDLPFVELCKKYAQISKQGNLNENMLRAQVLAYQGKYQQAANVYVKAGAPDQAMRLFSELKRFDQAQRFARNAVKPQDGQGKAVMSSILNQQATWALQNGDWKTAGQLYLSSRNYKKAIQIYSKENYMEGLIEVCRTLDKADNQANLVACANSFRKNKHHAYAKEAYLKLGDVKSLMSLHVEMERWEDAFLLGRQSKELLEIAKLPYANFLLKNDRYEEALKAFKSLGRSDLTQKMLVTLGTNAVSEKRFLDAARHYWTMAVEQLRLVKDMKSITPDDKPIFSKYTQLRNISQIYFVYNSVNTFVESPFFTSSDSALYAILNACRFLISKLGQIKLPYINLSYIYYSLAKVSRLLEGYKTARSCYERLAQLKVPNKWAEEIDLGSLLVRSKPYSDKQAILPICNRCLMENPIISEKDSCFSCKHPFVMSFVSFEVLPLVEFRVEPGISHTKVLELLSSDKGQPKKGKKTTKKDDGWNQTKNDRQQVLAFRGKAQQIENTPFYQKMSETVDQQQTQNDYLPITLGPDVLSTLQLDSVYVQDLRKINPSWQIRYFKNLVPDLLLKCCTECGKFFLLDEYEFEYVQHGKCPFCNIQDKRAGQVKDVFDV